MCERYVQVVSLQVVGCGVKQAREGLMVYVIERVVGLLCERLISKLLSVVMEQISEALNERNPRVLIYTIQPRSSHRVPPSEAWPPRCPPQRPIFPDASGDIDQTAHPEQSAGGRRASERDGSRGPRIHRGRVRTESASGKGGVRGGCGNKRRSDMGLSSHSLGTQAATPTERSGLLVPSMEGGTRGAAQERITKPDPICRKREGKEEGVRRPVPFRSRAVSGRGTGGEPIAAGAAVGLSRANARARARGWWGGGGEAPLAGR